MTTLREPPAHSDRLCIVRMSFHAHLDPEILLILFLDANLIGEGAAIFLREVSPQDVDHQSLIRVSHVIRSERLVKTSCTCA